MKVRNPSDLRQKIQGYYETLPEDKLWLPEDTEHRHFRFRCVNKYGHAVWRKIKDRIDTKHKLRRHLKDNYALDPYYTASSWLNPSELGAKDKGPLNVFLYSDFILDIDTMNKHRIKEAYSYLADRFSNRLSLRFSGGGYHICVHNWFRSDTPKPREREEECQEKMKQLCIELIEEGINFDYRLGNEGDSITSPSHNSRGVFKLPTRSLTHHGTVAEMLDIDELDEFEPTKVFDVKLVEPVTFERLGNKIKNAIKAQ